MGRMSFTRDASHRKIARIKAMLAERPMSSVQIAAAVPISKRGAAEYLQLMHKAGEIYIERWIYDVLNARVYPRPAYRLGNKPDAAKPAPSTPAERAKRYREAIRKDPERKDRALAKRRLRSADVRPDVAAAWIFGGA